MNAIVRLLLIGVISLVALNPALSQIFRPEGMNMPGTYDPSSYSNPPTLNSLGGIQKLPTGSGRFLLDTGLAVDRYTTLIFADSALGVPPGGPFTWLFTSGPSNAEFQNKWANVNVIPDSLQNYVKEGASDNTVTLNPGKYYTVNFKDNNYTNTTAIWIETATAPVSIISVTQSPLPGSVTAGTPVTVTVGTNAAKSADENVYVRYTTDNYATMTLTPVTFGPQSETKTKNSPGPGTLSILAPGGTTGTATIPGFPGGTVVGYYVFSTKFTNPVSDIDMKTIQYNNNNGANYSYTVPSPVYTISATAGPHGSITPAGMVSVTSGDSQKFTMNPTPPYFVDSVFVDHVYIGSPATYTFHTVSSNHTISVVFAHNVNELFQVNMTIQGRKGLFKPDSDYVLVRASFNGFGTGDTLKDPDHDSIYAKVISLKANSPIDYKFYKKPRGPEGYEDNISNRTHNVPDVNDTIPPVYFDDDNPFYNVTFRLNMRTQLQLGNFRPDLGDVATVRGSFNDFGNSTNNPDTLKDPDHDSVYTKSISLQAGRSQEYKFWKTFRAGRDYEVLPGGPFVNREYTVPFQNDLLPQKYFSDDSVVTVVSVSYSNHWNMVSLPVASNDTRRSVLFPTAGSNLFGYNAGYYPTDTMEQGRGYWLKLNADQKILFTGAQANSSTIDVDNGWNLIGSITSPINTSAITSIPSGIVTSNYFGYSNGYVTTTTLNPGKGYWVKVNQAGQLFMTSPAAKLASAPTSGFPGSGASRLTLRDAGGASQTLYVSGSLNGVSPRDFALPPAPPATAFDARFASDRMLEVVSGDNGGVFPILLKTLNYPVSVTWDGKVLNAQATLNLGGKEIPLGTDGSMMIHNPVTGGDRLNSGITLKVYTVAGLPREFALKQNYPNPFNPATVIGYQLPAVERSATSIYNVSLKIYDALGQLVATLVNGTQDAGSKSVSWDARNRASGVYFYRLEAVSTSDPARAFVDVKKLLLLR